MILVISGYIHYCMASSCPLGNIYIFCALYRQCLCLYNAYIESYSSFSIAFQIEVGINEVDVGINEVGSNEVGINKVDVGINEVRIHEVGINQDEVGINQVEVGTKQFQIGTAQV